MKKSFDICYEVFGNSDNPPMILIMGIGGQLIDWPLALIEGLVEGGFYVVIFDNRDSGLSRHYDELGVPNLDKAMASKQQDQPLNPPYTLEDMALDVIALMDKLRIDKAHIVGLSMGGVIAQYVALNFIDRVLSLTCIASTSGDPQLPEPKKEVLEYFSSSMNTQVFSMESSINNRLKLLRIYSHPDYFDEEKTKNQLMMAYKRANDPVGFKRLMLAMVCAAPRTEKLKKLKIPCLIIHGDCDPLFPVEHGKQLAQSIEGSHLEIIKKMGHRLPDLACNKIVDLMIKYIT